MNPEDDPARALVGIDAEWYACDADEHVGMFTTAGGGYAPEPVWRDVDAQVAVIEAILGLPRFTSARPAFNLPGDLSYGDLSSWLAVADRGLFAFDSDFFGGPYRLIVVPDVPIVVADLPALARTAVRELSYPNLHFATATIITSDDLEQRRPG